MVLGVVSYSESYSGAMSNNLKIKKITNQSTPKGIHSGDSEYENLAPIPFNYPFGIGRLEAYPTRRSFIRDAP